MIENTAVKRHLILTEPSAPGIVLLAGCGVQLTSPEMRHRVYLSLGSNVGDREKQLYDAIARLEDLGHVLSVSSLYETEPVEVTDQPWFLNCAVALETILPAERVMAAVLHTEREMGRERVRQKGPRIIDTDILFYDDMIVDSPALTIPHPAMHQRRFVLQPLTEIAPDVRHPVLKKTVQELLHALPSGQAVRKV